MKKTILFMVIEQYADWEAAYLASALQMLGQGQYETKTVGLTKEPVTSIGGFKVLPDYEIGEVPSDYEALILIGGMTWRTEAVQKIKPLVTQCLSRQKVLGGICDASTFLGAAGVLNGVKHTSNDLNDLKQWAGEAYTGEESYIREQAVRDDKLITANGTAALEFAKEVMLALGDVEEAKILEWYQFHKLGYYKASIPENATDWNEQ